MSQPEDVAELGVVVGRGRHQKARPDPVGEAELATEAQVIHPYGIGIDAHSQFIAVCVLRRAEPKVVRWEKQFATTWPQLHAARLWALEKAGELEPGALRYCVESTSTYHFPILQALGGVPSVVNPLLAGPTRRKTDVLDARLLAHHSITGLWPSSFVADDQAQQLRVLWADRTERRRRATRASNRINNLMLRFGHTFAARVPVRTPQGQALVGELCEGAIPEHPGVAVAGLPASVRPIIGALLETYRAERAAATQAEKRAVAFVQGRSWPTSKSTVSGQELLPCLMSVPGVGQTTAMTWLAEVCDPRRFTDAKEVSAYSGCDPSLKVSAGKVTSHTRRRGNLRLHWALVQAATGLLRRPGTPLAQWGLSLQGRHKKGGYRKATGALARRLAVMLWHVHRLGVKFDPSKYCFEAVPPVPCVPIAAMGLAPRVTALLAGYGDSRAAAAAYYKGHLASLPGFGPAAMQALGKWIHEHTTHHRPTPRANETKPEPSSSAAAGGPTSTGAVPGRPVAVRQNNHATSEGRAA